MTTNPDYVIVGAGAAGCVLAHRLTSSPTRTVMLLEAGGPDKQQAIQIPAAFSKLFKTEADWHYQTEPQPHLDNRRLYWPRGKMLGGSTSMNAMIYIRGHRHTYDKWVSLGNDGWGWDDVLPYFKKGQHQERGGDSYHGTGGPQNVADLGETNPISQAIVAAAQSVGYPRTNDFNGAEQEGVGFYQVTQKKGQRHSAAAAYLTPVLKRPNLTVRTEAQVTRILFEGKKAVGVEYTSKGKRHTVRCRREVLLCGGAINSPQLLMVSGVGPGAALQALGIAVIHDLAGVGQNLQDHLLAGVMYESTKPVSLLAAEGINSLFRYLTMRKGMLSSNVAEVGAFIKVFPDSPLPDLQIHAAPSFYVNHGFDNPPGHGFAIGVTLVQPRSRGDITLASPDPLAHPRIQPCYLSDERDWQLLLKGMAIVRQIGQADPLTPYRGAEVLPGPEVQSEADLRTFLSKMVETIYHPVGTCKMGTDAMAVVNPSLQVHGIEGLRVIDASIMPTIPNGNTAAPTMMIAEKAAHYIPS